MTKELQNKAWSLLPKEFKEEVKKIYNHNPGAKPMPENTSRGKSILRDIFGHDNLTSDAEGEEMLMCAKSKVMKLYNKFQKDGTFTCLYAAGVLDTLFDAKSLPDEKQNLSNLDKTGKDCNAASPSQNSPENCDKQFDTILKDSFAKGRRLNVAVQMIKAMMGCPEIVDRISSAETDSLLDDILHDALYLTDKLIAECEKGDSDV